MADAKNISIRGKQAGDAAAFVKDRFVLRQLSETSRLAVSYALVKDVQVTSQSAEGPVIHNFNIATIDPGGYLLGLIRALRATEDMAQEQPYRLIEGLMNEGLRLLATDIRSGELNDISELVALGEEPETL
jgi:hypothetical protein